MLETNVDDLDPRVWPAVIEAVLAAGAKDAWLTPILMKKGRPAHTFHALVAAGDLAAVRATVFEQTSTIGVRSHAVERTAQARETTSVVVGGQEISVKVTAHTAQPEHDDVVRAAQVLDRPVRDVLAEAAALAAQERGDR